MMFFSFVCHFALLLSFWFHTKTFCRYVHIIGDGCECVSVFLSFGLCIVCILAFFGVIVVSPSMVPYTCMWTEHIRVHVCSLKFVSIRNMFFDICTHSTIQISAIRNSYIDITFSQYFPSLFGIVDGFLCQAVFYERAYVFVFHFDGRTNQFQVFDFRCCALCSVLYHICV